MTDTQLSLSEQLWIRSKEIALQMLNEDDPDFKTYRRECYDLLIAEHDDDLY